MFVVLKITPNEHSTNFVVIESKPAIINQKVTPGPPIEIAIATPPIFPIPTVPDTAVLNA